MAKSLKISEDIWINLYNRVAVDYPRSVLMIRERMKEVLGFTMRRHVDYPEGRYRCVIYLDFYNEPKRTMFLLKYGDLLDETKT